jgi:hypothetical protein
MTVKDVNPVRFCCNMFLGLSSGLIFLRLLPLPLLLLLIFIYSIAREVAELDQDIAGIQIRNMQCILISQPKSEG